MTGSHPDPRASDNDLDPTGVRALLANLPDPGPMPDDLMTRISQSLELEQERRATAGTSSVSPIGPGHGASGSEPSSGGSVVSLTAERQRRRPGRTVLWLGGAAAVAMVATVSVNQIVGGGTADDSGVAANVPATTDSVDSGAEAGGAAEGEQDSHDAGTSDAADDSSMADAAPPAEPTPAPGDEEAADGGGAVLSSTQVHAMAGTVELSATDWADEVSAWLGADLARGQSTWGATQARDCVEDSDLDTRAANTVLLSQAAWEDQLAILVVAEATAGDTAWVLSPDCQEILSGPTLLD